MKRISPWTSRSLSLIALPLRYIGEIPEPFFLSLSSLSPIPRYHVITNDDGGFLACQNIRYFIISITSRSWKNIWHSAVHSLPPQIILYPISNRSPQKIISHFVHKHITYQVIRVFSTLLLVDHFFVGFTPWFFTKEGPNPVLTPVFGQLFTHST